MREKKKAPSFIFHLLMCPVWPTELLAFLIISFKAKKMMSFVIKEIIDAKANEAQSWDMGFCHPNLLL